MYNQNINNDLALKYLIKKPEINQEKKSMIIFLHGVGSNEQGLFNLAEYLPENFYVISARSPYTLAQDSYAFYNVDFSSGSPVINPEQAEKSRNTIKEFIHQVTKKYNIDNVYLGGFSQGAIMSYSVALTSPELVKGIACFSGRILNEIRPFVETNETLQNLKVFMSHGTEDNVLPIHFAREAKNYLSILGITPDYYEFSGGHEIPQPMINNLNNWLKSPE